MKATYGVIALGSLLLIGCQSTSQTTDESRLTQALETATTERDVLDAFVSVYGGQVQSSENYRYAELQPVFIGNFFRAMDRQCGGNREVPQAHAYHGFGGLKHMQRLGDVAVLYPASNAFSEYGYVTDDLVKKLMDNATVKTPEQLSAMLLGIRSGYLTTEIGLKEDFERIVPISVGQTFGVPKTAEPYACVDDSGIRYIATMYGVWDSAGAQTKSFLVVTKPHVITDLTDQMHGRMEKYGYLLGAETYNYSWTGKSGVVTKLKFDFNKYSTRLNAFIEVANTSNRPIKLKGRQLVENIVDTGNKYLPVYSGRYTPSVSGSGCEYLPQDDKILMNPTAKCYMNYTYKVPSLNSPTGDRVTVSINGQKAVLEKQTKLDHLIEYKRLKRFF